MAKIILLVPVLAIIFNIFFAVVLFYYPSVRKKVFYRECELHEATHMLIDGVEKGVKELVKLYDHT